jgi:NAD(P)-dependent dehydrogenase (short-subunit alcohol dehydrogenase family)
MELRDKVAIVTGSGGGGCGRTIARRFAREGAAVVVCDIDEEGGGETVRLIGADRGRAAFLRADVSAEADVRALIAFAEQKYGGLDLLVNNASGPYRPEAPLDYWAETVGVELLGTMYATRHALEPMRRRGGGAIVSMSSISSLGHGRKHSASPAYDVAKAGVIRLTTTLGRLQEEMNIRVNCLVPGWIASPPVKAYWDGLTPEQRRERGVPDELISLDGIANVVVRLATDASLAGRAMVWWNCEPPRLISRGDPGYVTLE